MKSLLGCEAGWLVVLVGAAVLAVSRVAAAAPSVVLESHEGERPADAESVLAAVYADLAHRGFVARAPLARRIESRLSREPASLTATQTVEAQQAVDRAYQGLVDGDYAAAAAEGRKALAFYAAASGQLAREGALRELQFKALLVTARALEASGRGEDAFATMAEAIRTFPDRHVSAAEFDPKVNALFRRVREELVKQGTGALEIKADDPSVVIFVNERFVGMGSVKIDALLRGPYRIYVAKGPSRGRIHDVQIDAGGATTLTVNWQLEGRLRTIADYVGLEFPANATAQQQIDAATRLGRELKAPTVVILSLRVTDSRREIVGYAVSMESQTRVFASVQIEPVAPSPRTLAQLGALLAGEKNVDTTNIVITRSLPGSADPAAAAAPVAWYEDRWGWGFVVGGAALTTVATLTGLSAADLRYAANAEPTESIRRNLRERADARVVVAGTVGAGAAALVLAGIVKLAIPEDPEPLLRGSARLAAGLDWVGIQGEF